MACFFGLGLAQVFNPYSPSLFYGLLGLKLYFYYVPLMFVGYALMRTEHDLHRFLVVNMGVAAVIATGCNYSGDFGVDFFNPDAVQILILWDICEVHTRSGVSRD